MNQLRRKLGDEKLLEAKYGFHLIHRAWGIETAEHLEAEMKKRINAKWDDQWSRGDFEKILAELYGTAEEQVRTRCLHSRSKSGRRSSTS